MQMHDARRVEVIIEGVMEKQVTRALEEAGVTGFTILPVLGGSGRSGRWTREGTVGRGTGMIAVICLIAPDRLDALLEALFPVLNDHIGVVSVTDTHILRAERF
ncbi:transcriptional regulator [Pararhodobacter sp. SW119]|uniref:P-II family nitrogen regulator n=1 Tax=Pararhodobacter sp. SW119 TaxID=2780075 RepID=UPI001ADF9DC1|nr:transcriptional regulator [Pararhodobacter sp. SW119]